MNSAYKEAKQIVDEAKRKLEKLLEEKSTTKTFEDEEAYYTLSGIIDRLTSASSTFDYLDSPVKEGILELDSVREKYYILYENGETSSLLSCGNALEAFLNDDWVIGRVEATSKGEYYFYGSEKPLLFPGMTVRKRIV